MTRLILLDHTTYKNLLLLWYRAASDGLAVSLMERAVNLHSDQITKMLTTQYRMNAAIMQWSSDELYDSKLIAADSVSSHLLSDLPGVEATEDTSVPLVLIDTTGNESHSFYKLSHVRECNTVKCSASASDIQQVLRPPWIWDADALYFSVFHSRFCDNVFTFKQTWRVT